MPFLARILIHAVADFGGGAACLSNGMDGMDGMDPFSPIHAFHGSFHGARYS